MQQDKDSDSELVQLHAIFRGRVQGVGFRGTVRHHAAKRGVRGVVKNLVDGSVEMYALGSQSELEQLLEDILGDMGFESVSSVTKEYMSPPTKEFGEFRIVF